MIDLSAYREQVETLLRHSPSEAVQVALEEHDRVATIKNRFRRALREVGDDNLALRFRSVYSPEQEKQRLNGERPQPEKLLVTYTRAGRTGEATPRRGKKRGGSSVS